MGKTWLMSGSLLLKCWLSLQLSTLPTMQAVITGVEGGGDSCWRLYLSLLLQKILVTCKWKELSAVITEQRVTTCLQLTFTPSTNTKTHSHTNTLSVLLSIIQVCIWALHGIFIYLCVKWGLIFTSAVALLLIFTLFKCTQCMFFYIQSKWVSLISYSLQLNIRIFFYKGMKDWTFW